MRTTFQVQGESHAIEHRDGMLLSTLSAEAGFPLNLQCGGQGACHGCRVTLGEGVYRIGGAEVHLAAGETREARACRTTVLGGEPVVAVPESSLLRIGECSAADFYTDRKPVFGAKDSQAEGLGVAVDIGTTTVAALLVERATGEILARESAYNQQIELGTDVSTRITLCRDEAHVAKLQQLIVRETIEPMLDRLALTSRRHLDEVTMIIFSGNTVMSHLVLGLSALSIGTIPFEPLTRVFRDHAAPEVGLKKCPNARVWTVPAISGYVGGDIVSDLYTCMPSPDALEMVVDIGTNGEIVLNNRGHWIATATAAGPAFEGAGLLHGCRAGAGVIEQILCHNDDSIEVDVIGDVPPHGLCGSAAIDFMATAFESGLLNTMGRFDIDRLRAAGRLEVLEAHGIKVNACVIVPDGQSGREGPVLVTEFDVSQILKAKGAVYAGIRTLLDRAGRCAADLQRLVLAGGFAAHLRIEHAITVGLLPEIPLEKYDVIGNGSLAGAYAALGTPSVFEEFLDIANRPETVHLNETEQFNDLYIDAMALPNLDPDQFPATLRRM